MVMIAVVIVVVIIPVTVRAPAVSVFVPPPARVRPAVLPLLVQSLSCVCCLRTLPAIPFNRLVHPMVGFRNAPLAGSVIGANRRRSEEHESPCQRQGRKRRPYPYPQRRFLLNAHFYAVLRTID
jgi:hypothetical protein